MTVKLIKNCPTEIKLSEDNGAISAPSQVQLLKTGTFSYFYDDDMMIDESTLLSMIINFENNVRGIDLAIDYGHDCYGEAAGWIKKIYMSADRQQLWGEISWNAKGERALIEKEYRYISCEFSFNYEDEDSEIVYGPTLFGAGLTNRPFLKSMKPLTELSEKDKENVMTLDELKKKVEEQEREVKKLSEKLSEKELSEQEKEKKIQDLEREGRESRALNEKTNAFNKMLAEGKVVEAQRQPFLDGDMIQFSERAGKIKLDSIGGQGEPAKKDGEELTPEQAEEELEKKAKEEFEKAGNVKTFSECVRKVLSENKKLAEKYEAKF